jgi:hypothetical protein
LAGGVSEELEWHALQMRLEALKNAVTEEIRNYPPPIPACDAHFNHLLELRRELSRGLARLDLAAKDKSITVEDFVRSLPSEAVVFTS